MNNCEACGNELRTCGKCGWSKVYEEDMGGLREQVEQWKGIVEKQHLSTIKYKDRVEQEIEQLKAQNAQGMEQLKFYEADFKYLRSENKALRADNAALLKCVHYYAKNDKNEIVRKYGAVARECIAKLGGDRE